MTENINRSLVFDDSEILNKTHTPASAILLFFERFYTLSSSNGFWDKERNKGEMIALMHSELSEALEGVRKPDKMDDHLPHLPLEVVELADVFIRLGDYIHGHGLTDAFMQAVKEKHNYNCNRPYKHGKKF